MQGYKYIKEWSEMFVGGDAINESSVTELIRSHKKRKHIKQSFDRLCARGLVKHHAGKFVSTESGVWFFRRKMGVKYDKVGWDGKWRLISFDVPGNYSKERDALRTLLKEFEFYQLQKSVWVCPSNVSEDFWYVLRKKNLQKYCKIMLVDVVEGDGELKKHFKL